MEKLNRILEKLEDRNNRLVKIPLLVALFFLWLWAMLIQPKQPEKPE